MAGLSNTRGQLAAAALGLVAAKLVLHLLVAVWTPYEFHRDEFLYFAMGNHLRILHMDFPPMMALLAEAVRGFSDSSLVAYRLVPALAGAALMLLALLTVRELGGGRTAQVVTILLLIFNPLFLRTATLFQPVVIDQFWWMLGFYALVRLENTGERRWWLMLGLAGGLGLLSKFSILFFGAAVLVALLLTPRRRDLLTRWPWVTLALALVIGAPSLIGQVTLDFPLLDQMSGLKERQLSRITFGEYLSDQVLWGPVAFLFAIAGLAALLWHPALKRFRVAGWTALAAFVLFAVTRGKAYYVGPIYPMLFAAAAVWAEQLARPKLRAALVWGLPAVTVVYCLAILPFGLPILPPETMARYAQATGVGAGV
ncbi:MAG TPA: glycosyltransferase family 39 protein, partial [Gemmatimonadales bacterium]|nr:glycosyltransferase family 39 protein [Gemmatimonadales bacterium]